jgi:hypothetical protein
VSSASSYTQPFVLREGDELVKSSRLWVVVNYAHTPGHTARQYLEFGGAMHAVETGLFGHIVKEFLTVERKCL